jgi:transcriptional regulator with XRE-family HTH domain
MADGLAAYLRHLRERADRSQMTASKRAGLHETYLSKLEAGGRRPTIGALMDILEALDASVNERREALRLLLEEIAPPAAMALLAPAFAPVVPAARSVAPPAAPPSPAQTVSRRIRRRHHRQWRRYWPALALVAAIGWGTPAWASPTSRGSLSDNPPIGRILSRRRGRGGRGHPPRLGASCGRSPQRGPTCRVYSARQALSVSGKMRNDRSRRVLGSFPRICGYP